MVKLSVIVCTYDRACLLRQCLNSLFGQSLDKSLYEVIVVDNGSIDKTKDVIADFLTQYINLRYISEEKQGLSNARNRGWLEAEGKYVAFIDDDAKASPQWCELILNAFETVKPQPAAVGGPFFPCYENVPPAWFIDELETGTLGSASKFLEGPYAKFGLFGSNMAFRRSVLESNGGFNPCYGMGSGMLFLCEETDFFYRINKNDCLFWYDPNIKVFHFISNQKFKIPYRFKRFLTYGISMGHIERINLFSVGYMIKRWNRYCCFIKDRLFSLFKSDSNRKKSFIHILDASAVELGYIIAIWLRLLRHGEGKYVKNLRA